MLLGLGHDVTPKTVEYFRARGAWLLHRRCSTHRLLLAVVTAGVLAFLRAVPPRWNLHSHRGACSFVGDWLRGLICDALDQRDQRNAFYRSRRSFRDFKVGVQRPVFWIFAPRRCLRVKRFCFRGCSPTQITDQSGSDSTGVSIGFAIEIVPIFTRFLKSALHRQPAIWWGDGARRYRKIRRWHTDQTGWMGYQWTSGHVERGRVVSHRYRIRADAGGILPQVADDCLGSLIQKTGEWLRFLGWGQIAFQPAHQTEWSERTSASSQNGTAGHPSSTRMRWIGK